MKVAAVTTFSPRGYETYGKRMIQSFIEWWPIDVPLYVFYEGEKPKDADERVQWVSFRDDLDHAAFGERNEDVGRDYRYQCVRFSHKVFAATKAPRNADWLIWLDGDTETIREVNHDFLNEVLPDGYVASYLGRSWTHSETGFVGYRLNETGKQFLDEMREYYVTDRVYHLSECHDCAVFDAVRKSFEYNGHRFFNLCPNASTLDCWKQSPLQRVMTHFKGPKAKQAAYA